MPEISPEKNKPSISRKVIISNKYVAPTLTKVLPINPFANWNMPPQEKQYIKHRDRDCL
jgi:hypothetical protein